MTDIVISPLQELKTRRRAFRVEIENPLNGTQSIIYQQEDVTVDVKDVEFGKRYAGSISVPMTDLFGVLRDISDPVTGKTVSISGAAIAMWIEADYVERALAALNPPQTTPEEEHP
jgi:hypothetical protein